eukprot:1384398-Prymnesium_polylepis.1
MLLSSARLTAARRFLARPPEHEHPARHADDRAAPRPPLEAGERKRAAAGEREATQAWDQVHR